MACGPGKREDDFAVCDMHYMQTCPQEFQPDPSLPLIPLTPLLSPPPRPTLRLSPNRSASPRRRRPRNLAIFSNSKSPSPLFLPMQLRPCRAYLNFLLLFLRWRKGLRIERTPTPLPRRAQELAGCRRQSCQLGMDDGQAGRRRGRASIEQSGWTWTWTGSG